MLTTKVVSNKKPPLLSDSESGGSTSPSSKKIMGKFANHLYQKIILIIVGIIVTCLNLTLLWEIFYK